MYLKINNLKKDFGDVHALQIESLALSEGIIGLLGPNGAGKSTLMNILTGNLSADSGEILCDGISMDTVRKTFQTKLGYAPQQQALYPTFTARHFLNYVAALRGMSKQDAEGRISWSLKKVGLDSVSNKRIQTFSGGMKQRLVIAQAILADPEIIILDEPTAGLDPKQRISVRNLLSEIAANKMIIIATHVVSDIEYIAKEIVLLKNGQILRQGSRSELTKELQGHVFELNVPVNQWNAGIKNRYLVDNLTLDDGIICARVLSQSPITGYKYRMLRPTLEDVYLWHFGEQGDHLA